MCQCFCNMLAGYTRPWASGPGSMNRDATYPSWHSAPIFWQLGGMQDGAHHWSLWCLHMSCPMVIVHLYRLHDTCIFPQLPIAYATSQAKHCHALLQLVCSGDRSHIGPKLLAALGAQTKRWLTPCHLQPGKFMCDNHTNLLAVLTL